VVPGRRSLFVVSIGLVMSVVAGVAVVRGQRSVGLADELGWHEAATPAMATREAEAVQRRIADCMARLDLPYVEFVDPALEIPDADLGPRGWAATWGFGVATSVGVADGRPPVADPNLAHIETLPPADGEPYRAALFGTATSPGCAADANDAVYGRHDRLLAGLAGELTELEQRIAADPRTVDADARWLECASTPVFRPSSRHAFGPEAIDEIGRRLQAIMGSPAGAADFDRTALEHLQASEIEVALRGIDCDARVRPTLESVRLEYEARFVEAHRATLDDIKARARTLDAQLGLTPAPPPDPVSFEP
jgi:hypothetical protein